jgi:TATA-binding protein-associated factor
MYCVLDEGHLIKNPKTATAKAARCLRSRHKIILSGSPVQNKVQELWAAFDWLMPNYLGSDADFAERFGRDIAKSHLPGASVSNMRRGMNKLKILHQQVLPFILRREKGDVLKQLPPKIITDVPCWLTEKQSLLYESLCSGEETRRALESLQAYIKMNENRQKYDKQQSIGKDVLRSLIRLRMICTHPLLLKASQEKSCLTIDDQTLARFDVSGKICVLNDLLRNAGIFREDITAADNDQSLIYVQSLDTVSEHTKHENHISNLEHNEDMLEDINCDEEEVQSNESKCLIFAQFTQSLDIVEQLLFKPLMPSLRYVRIDGSVDTGQRECIIDQFVNDDSVKCMLLTTKVGSLGLNLQAADTVIFLEPDYNPHVDLQAMDRAHRIGQEKVRIVCIIIYYLFCSKHPQS